MAGALSACHGVQIGLGRGDRRRSLGNGSTRIAEGIALAVGVRCGGRGGGRMDRGRSVHRDVHRLGVGGAHGSGGLVGRVGGSRTGHNLVASKRSVVSSHGHGIHGVG